MTDEESKIKLAETVLRQGEIKLAAQLTIALAADSRAMALTNFFLAIATAILGLSVGLVKSQDNWWMLLAGIFAGLPWLYAAWTCIQVARPYDIHIVGNQPRHWWDDNVEAKPLFEVLKKESNN